MLSFVLKIIAVYLLSTVAYYLWIIATSYRIFKFACTQNGRFIPLMPFVGNTYLCLFTGLRVNMLSSLLLFDKICGLPGNIWFGHKYHYTIKDAEEARIVFNHPKCLDKAEMYGDLSYVFRNSILMLPGEQWKRRRRFLRSAFNTRMIEQFIPTLYEQCCLLVERLKTKPPEQYHFKFFNTHAFMSFFLTSIGWMEEDVQDSDIVKFAELIDKFQDEFVKLLINPIVPIYIWIRTPPGERLRKVRNELKKVLKTILIRKKEQMAKLAEFVDKKTDLPLIELLLSDGYEAIQDSDVFEEFTFFAAAATDTTGHSLVFTFTLIGMYPEIQQKIYDEVMSAIGDKQIDSLNVEKLIYTEAVISEAMRILPAVPGVGRHCNDDIEFADKVVPKGANILISMFHIHRNPDYWEDPLKFNPDRFLPENLHKIVPGSYIPFTGGPRICIGQRMALVLMKITVAHVVRNFQILSNHKSVKEFKLISCISMKTRNHLDLRFVPRNLT